MISLKSYPYIYGYIYYIHIITHFMVKIQLICPTFTEVFAENVFTYELVPESEVSIFISYMKAVSSHLK